MNPVPQLPSAVPFPSVGFRVHVNIGDTPYTFTRDEKGWRVVPADSPTSRFYRSYRVYTEPNGTPLRCTCPHCYHRQAWCKHLQAAEQLQTELKETSRA